MKTIIFIFAVFYYSAISLSAKTVIEITQGLVKPEPISLTKAHAPYASSIAEKIDEIIAQDLKSSGVFDLMDPNSFMQTSQSLLEGVRYNDWQPTKTRFLYFSALSKDSGKITIKFELHDVIRGQKMISFTLSAEESKWRRIAHMVADAIYNAVTGEAGFFNTQVAFVEPTNKKGRNLNTCIKIMDSDGDPHSIVKITDGNSLVLTPRYAPDGKTIVYLRIDKNTGEVYIADRNTKVSKLMGKYKGLNFAPRYSPDSKKIIFSIAKGTSTAIYEQDLYSKSLKQLTPHHGIDTSPGYSPDGEKIVFVSDRTGRPKLYTMNSDGSQQECITPNAGTYTQPCWSPRGDFIAFNLQKGGQFYIGIMRTDGSDQRLIATGYLVEDPIWTSNGRYLLFTLQPSLKSKQQIIRMDITGKHQYVLKTPSEAFGPSLSPLLGKIGA